MDIDALRSRVAKLSNEVIPQLQQSLANAKAQQELAIQQLKQAGWQPDEDVEVFLSRLRADYDTALAALQRAVEEAESAVSAIR